MSAKTKITGLMVALMTLSVPMVYADSGTGDKDTQKEEGQHHDLKGGSMAKVLNLTDDQAKQMKALLQKERESMKSAFEQAKTVREGFNTEIVKVAPDMNKIGDLENQLKAVQAQMADNRLNLILEIKKILSPEQFSGYMTLKKEREVKMFSRHEEGRKHWGDRSDDKNHMDEDQD